MLRAALLAALSPLPSHSALPVDCVITSAALPPRSAALNLTSRVVLRLEQAEARETNPHFQTDYRISRLLVIFAFRGNAAPLVEASQIVLGTHPDQVFAKLTAQRQEKLGAEYPDWYDANGNLKPEFFSVKKPPQSVTAERRKERA